MLHLYPDHDTPTVRPGHITGERTDWWMNPSLVIEGEDAEQKDSVGW